MDVKPIVSLFHSRTSLMGQGLFNMLLINCNMYGLRTSQKIRDHIGFEILLGKPYGYRKSY